MASAPPSAPPSGNLASVGVDVEGAEALAKRFGLLRHEVRLVLRTAKNKTALWGRTRVREGVGDVVLLKRKLIARAVTSTAARTPEDAATVDVQRAKVAMSEYGPQVSKSNGVTVSMSNQRGSLQLKHAFRAKLRSGHVGIFLRAKLSVLTASTTPDDLLRAFGEASGTEIDRRQTLHLLRGRFGKIGYRKGRVSTFRRVLPSGYAPRYPLEQLYGPTVIDQMVDKTTLTKVGATALKDIKAQFAKNVQSQVRWILSGKAASALEGQTEMDARRGSAPAGDT